MRLETQTVFHTAGNIVYLTSLWLLTVFTTRMLGYEAVGNLTLAISVGNVFFFVQQFGVRSFQSSDMAFEYAPAVYLRTRILTALMGAALCLMTCRLVGYSLNNTASILLFLLFKTSEVISDVLFGDDQRHGRLELAGYSLALRGIVTIPLFALSLRTFHNLNAALLAIAVGGVLITLLLDVPQYRNTVPDRGRATGRECLALLRDCAALLLTSLLPMVITAIPRIALELYHGARLLGFYGNLSTPGLVVTTVIPVLLTALLPSYGQRYQERDNKAIGRMWLTTIALSAGFTGVCCLGILVLGKPVLAFVYTEQIVAYVRYLYYIMFAMMLYAVTVCNSVVLISVRKKGALAVFSFIAFVICLLTAPALVRVYGINGATSALALSYGAQVLAQSNYIVYCLYGRKGN